MHLAFSVGCDGRDMKHLEASVNLSEVGSGGIKKRGQYDAFGAAHHLPNKTLLCSSPTDEDVGNGKKWQRGEAP